MKKLLVIAAFIVIGYKVLTIHEAPSGKLDPLYPEPYIVVYGRKTCGNTMHLQTELRNKGLRYHYVDVDAQGASEALYQRMEKAGLSSASFTLPVVEVNARMSTNPRTEWVVGNYHVDHTGRKR